MFFLYVDTEEEIEELVKVYSESISNYKDYPGISYEDLVKFPKFKANIILRRVAELYLRDHRLYVEEFIEMCSVLSKITCISQKKQCK